MEDEEEVKGEEGSGRGGGEEEVEGRRGVEGGSEGRGGSERGGGKEEVEGSGRRMRK